MKYPKIYNLWRRNQKGVLIEGAFSKEEFRSINRWKIVEKIDGENVLIRFVNRGSPSVEFFSRNLHPINIELRESIEDIFSVERFLEVFPKAREVRLYGEGVGYRGSRQYGQPEPTVVLFDAVVIDGKGNEWWLNHESLSMGGMAKFKVPRAPLIYDFPVSLDRIVEFMDEQRPSRLCEEMKMEGIIAISYPIVLFRDAKTPVKFKLKFKDVMKWKST